MNLVAVLPCLILTALLSSSKGQSCSRSPPPFPASDCSTANGDCRFLHNEAGDEIGRLPFPSQNTRSCFRTCFHTDGTCRVTQSPFVDNQALRPNAGNDQYTQREIHSPRYSRRPQYRKSEICRHQVVCDEGQVLSYSIHDLRLEPPATCNGEQRCVDWLEIDVPGYGDSEILCGTRDNDNTFFLDGQSSMDIEFVTNRDNQGPGFLLFATCSDEGFTRSRPEEQTEGNETRKRAVSEECTFPPSRPQMPPSQPLMYLRGPIALFQQQITPRRPLTLEEEVEALRRRNNTISRVVAMGDLVAYNLSVVTLFRDERNELLNENFLETFRGIAEFRLINRISRRRFIGVAPQIYTGFGHLIIVGRIAYFFQLGADPRFQPTPEEARIAFALERGIVNTVGIPEDEDTGDLLDILEEYPPCYYSPLFPIRRPCLQCMPFKTGMRYKSQQMSYKGTCMSTCFHEKMSKIRRLCHDRRLDELALLYGNACNGVLRAAACSYQEQVLRRDCITGRRLFPFFE